MMFAIGTKVGIVIGASKGGYHLYKGHTLNRNDYITHGGFIGLGYGLDALSTFVTAKVATQQFTENIVTNISTHDFIHAWCGSSVGIGIGYFGIYMLANSFTSGLTPKVDDNMSKKE